jgi:hypothetical protein
MDGAVLTTRIVLTPGVSMTAKKGWVSPFSEKMSMPEEIQTFELQENLLLATNELEWRRNDDGHVLLGSAVLCCPLES